MILLYFKRSFFTIFKSLAISLLLFSLLACTKPDANNYMGSANFFLTDSSSIETKYVIDSYKEKTNIITKAWSFPSAIQYTFKVCFKDSLQRSPLINEKFEINIDDSRVSQTTKDNGCLSWSEKIPFNYFADAHYLLLKRKLKAVGVYGGEILVEIIVNPWAKRDQTENSALYKKFDDKIIKLNKVVSKKEDIAKTLFGESQEKELFIDDFRVKLTKHGVNNSNKFNLYLSDASIYMMKKNVLGKESKFYLKDGGKYMVQTRLYEKHSTTGVINPLDSGNKKAPIVIFNSETKNKKIENIQYISSGPLRAEFIKELHNNWKQGYLLIILSVNPLNFPYQNFLKPFKGVYDGGLANGLAASVKSAKFLADITQEFNQKDKIKGGEGFRYFLESGSQKLTKNMFESYFFDSMNPKFLQIIKGETSTSRRINYFVQTCLKNPATTLSANYGERFEVLVTNEFSGYKEKFITEANQRGCISWVGQIYHKIYLPERLFDFDVKITELSSGVSNKRKLGYAINPWGDNLVFGTDRSQISERYRKENNERANIRSRFFISNFRYSTLRFRYNVDKYLNLEVKKTVLMHLYPTVLRYNSRTLGRYATYPAKDGVYLLKFALDKHYLDPTQKEVKISFDKKNNKHAITYKGSSLKKRHHLSVVKKLVRVINGEIITPIEFDISDVRILRIRAQLVAQLDAIDEQRLWLINYYNHFYEKNLKQAIKKGFISESLAEKLRLTEKIKNLYIIAQRMQKDDFFIENYIIKKMYELEGKTGQYKGKSYEYCNGEAEVTWSDIIKHFSLNQKKLEELFPGDLVSEYEKAHRDESIEINQFEIKRGEFRECLKPFNILRSLQLNEVVANRISPIKGFDLNELVDSSMGYEGDGSNTIPREAFTGPVTLLVNGNSSSMRTTRNIAENMCQETTDCDEISTEKLESIGDGFLTEEDKAHYAEIQKNKNFGYETSRYFNSLKYLNNVLVDDLIKKDRVNSEIHKREEFSKSRMYYYLNQANLKFYSLGDESVTRVDEEKCSDIFATDKNFELDCELVDNSLSLKGEYKQALDENKEELAQYIEQVLVNNSGLDTNKTSLVDSPLQKRINKQKAFAMPRNLAEISCKYFINKITRWSEVEKWSEVENKRPPATRGSFVAKNLHYVNCVKQLLSGETTGILDIEQKIRTEKIGKYFYRGGKSQNINVGSSFTYNYNKNFSESWGYGYNKSLGLKISALDLGEVQGDIKWSNSQANLQGNGIVVGTATYLAMQKVEIELIITSYRSCVTMSYSKAFIENKRVIDKLKKVFKLRTSNENKEDISELDILKDLRSGIMICTDIQNKDLPIRENYYYFTQHFTEGDIQDAGDIFNHPWLLIVRGASDMWRFIDLIKAQPYSNMLKAKETKGSNESLWSKIKAGVLRSFNFYVPSTDSPSKEDSPWSKLTSGVLRNFNVYGPVVDSPTWPLDQLSQAYESVIPSYPSIHSMMHTTEHRDWPWKDIPSDTLGWKHDSNSEKEEKLSDSLDQQIEDDRRYVTDEMGCKISILLNDGSRDITDQDLGSCKRNPVDSIIEFENGQKTLKPLNKDCTGENCSEPYLGDAKFLLK